MKNILKTIAIVLLIPAVFLLGLNFYGLTQEIRKPGLGKEPKEILRFENDIPLTYEASIKKINMLDKIQDPEQYLLAANALVNQSITHVEWLKVDPSEYRQLVPAWENYFLYFIGKFSGLEFYERYHFVDYKRSIKRGIGICGDASMILNQLLDMRNIDNDIVVFPGHVMISAKLPNGKEFVADPDFGVLLPIAVSELESNKAMVKEAYKVKGYKNNDSNLMGRILSGKYEAFDDTKHFITKRYYFEYASYVLKWLVPFVMLILSILAFRKANLS